MLKKQLLALAASFPFISAAPYSTSCDGCWGNYTSDQSLYTFVDGSTGQSASFSYDVEVIEEGSCKLYSHALPDGEIVSSCLPNAADNTCELRLTLNHSGGLPYSTSICFVYGEGKPCAGPSFPVPSGYSRTFSLGCGDRLPFEYSMEVTIGGETGEVTIAGELLCASCDQFLPWE